jgi:hypothetical protein
MSQEGCDLGFQASSATSATNAFLRGKLKLLKPEAFYLRLGDLFVTAPDLLAVALVRAAAVR